MSNTNLTSSELLDYVLWGGGITVAYKRAVLDHPEVNPLNKNPEGLEWHAAYVTADHTTFVEEEGGQISDSRTRLAHGARKALDQLGITDERVRKEAIERGENVLRELGLLEQPKPVTEVADEPKKGQPLKGRVAAAKEALFGK